MYAELNLGKSLRFRTVRLSLPMDATDLEERRCRCDVLITGETQNLKEHGGSCVSQRDAQGQHEMAVKQTCSARETDC